MLIIHALVSIALAQVGTITVTHDRDGAVAVLDRGGSVLGASLTFTASGSWGPITQGTCDSLFNFTPTSGAAGSIEVRAMPIDGVNTQTISAGQNTATGSCSGSINGENFTLNWKVSRTSGVFVTDFNGSFDSAWDAGCGKSNAIYTYKNSCTMTAAYAPQDGVALPAVGSEYTDPLHGGKGKRISSVDTSSYAAYRFNRDESLYVSADGVYNTSTGAKAADIPTTHGPVCDFYTTIYWDYRPNGTLEGGWCLYTASPLRIRAWHLDGSPGGTGRSFVDDGIVFTHTHNLLDLGTTGNNISVEGWFAFPDSNNKFCFLNIPQGSSTLSCADIETTIRLVQVAPREAPDGCIYGNAGRDSPTPASDNMPYRKCPGGVTTALTRMTAPDRAWLPHLFGDDWLTYAGYACSSIGNDCLRNGHHSYWWRDGYVGIMGNFINYQSTGSKFWVSHAGCSYNNGGDGCYPQELGGGGMSAGQFGLAGEYALQAPGAQVWAAIQYGSDTTRPRKVTTTESGGTCTGTLTGTNIFSTSQRVLLHRFSQASWNGYVTLASSSGSTITWACSGAGTALEGVVIDATPNTTSTASQQHIVVGRNNGHQRVIAAWPPSTEIFDQPFDKAGKIQISFSGKYVAANHNFGYPEERGPVLWSTGFEGCTATTKDNQFCGGGGLTVVRVGTTTALATVTTPYAPGACTLEWGQTLDFSGWTQQALSAGSTVRTHSITGLTAGQEYRARVWCDGMWNGTAKTNWNYAVTRWHQPAATSGTSVQELFTGPPAPVGSADMVLTYGTSSPPGSTTFVACAVGQRCTAEATINRNAVTYWRLAWRDVGGNVIHETPTISRVRN